MLLGKDYRDIINMMPDPVFVSEPIFNSKKEIIDFRVAYLNDAFVEKSDNIITVGCLHSEYQKILAIKEISDWGPINKSVVNENTPFTTSFFSPKTRLWMQLTLSKFQTNYLIGVFKDITAQKIQESYLSCMQECDMLTGLPNRAAFYKYFETAVRNSKEQNDLFGLYIIDIDDMKFINDIAGHDEGDTTIKHCANILFKNESSTVHSFRLGDDEFIILKTEAHSHKDLSMFAKYIFSQFIEKNIKVSMGISVFPTDDAQSNMLLKYADLAMHHVKNSGKCFYTFFTPSMYVQFLARNQMKRRIISALENNKFELFFQPQYKIATKKIRGFEALIRWHDYEQGWISPELFIPIAEESNVIISLGNWILETAIATLNEWQTKFNYNGIMSVNISPIQLKTPGFLKNIWSLIEKYQIKPNTLEIEITEGAFINDIEKTSGILSMIRKLGILIALDDFGTGYASLRYLNSLPITTLKIDKTFIDKLSSEHNISTSIISSIVSIVTESGIETIAEGIEHNEQLEMIRSLNFKDIQGYLSGKPMERCICETLLKDSASSVEQLSKAV